MSKPIFKREYVYKLIDGERDYQEEVQSQWDDSKWNANDWVTFIERYIKDVRDYTGNPEAQMAAIRKIGALAVVAMEYNETPEREL